MNNFKKAMDYKLGHLSDKKERVWMNMHQTKRKPLFPILLTAIVSVAVIGFAFLLMINSNKEIASDEPPVNTGHGAAVESEEKDDSMKIHSKQIVTTTAQLSDFSNIVGIVDTPEKYAYLSQLFEFTQEDINFEEQMLLVTQFGSNGCGLVAETLTLKAGVLTVELLLPEDIRGNKEIMCTEIFLMNTEFLVVDKADIQSVVFTQNDSAANGEIISLEPPALNALAISDKIQAIEFEELVMDATYSIKNPDQMRSIANMFNYGTALSGMRDMADPSYKITITFEDNSTRAFYIWHPYDSFIYAELTASEQAYTLPPYFRDQIINILNESMYN